MGHWIKSTLHIALTLAILMFIAARVPAVGQILGVRSN